MRRATAHRRRRPAPKGATTWYFAEGSQGFFHTYFLLFNPNVTDTVAHVTYLMEDGPAIEREYPVPARTRVTVDAGERPELLNRSFGARWSSICPALAERAMYFGETPLYAGGAAAAGVTAPATTLVSGRRRDRKFLRHVRADRESERRAREFELTYLPDAGSRSSRRIRLRPHQRLTLNIAMEAPSLVSAAVSTRVESDRPVVVERSQYWPHGNWYESHSQRRRDGDGIVVGDRGRPRRRRIAGADIHPDREPRRLGGDRSPRRSCATDGTTVVEDVHGAAASRFTIAVTGDAGGRGAGTGERVVRDDHHASQPVIVERSLYMNRNGTLWTAGTNSTATRLLP